MWLETWKTAKRIQNVRNEKKKWIGDSIRNNFIYLTMGASCCRKGRKMGPWHMYHRKKIIVSKDK